MNTVSTVFRKELKDQLRDRRTVMFMLVMPMLIFPLLFGVTIKISKSSREKAREKTLKVALLNEAAAPRFGELVRELERVELVPDVSADSVQAWVASGRLNGAWIVGEDFGERLAENRPGRIDYYYKAADGVRVIIDRIESPIEEYNDEIVDERLKRLDLPKDVAEGIDGRKHNVASVQEQLGKQIGGFLPYMFILFCFFGTMYPALDLGAGEKERGTLETLLTAPVNRFHILVGKLGVISASGLMSATMSITGLYVAFRLMDEIPDELLQLVTQILGWGTIATLLSLLLPLALFFAGTLLCISLTAKSFKEAQSMMTPLNFAVILPAAIGMLPGVEMNFATALIPILNVSLAAREIASGTIQTPHLMVTYATLITLAIGAVYLAAQWFRRESVIFRS